jgi:Zn-dependent metalloprotease
MNQSGGAERRGGWFGSGCHRSFRTFVLVVTVGLSLPSIATAGGANDEQLQALGRASRLEIAAGVDASGNRLRTLRGRFASDTRDRREAARRFLERNAEVLNLRSDLSDLRFARQLDDPGGSTILFEQEHRGRAVFQGVVLVAFDAQGSMIHLQNDHQPELTLPVVPSLSAAEAIEIAERALQTRFRESQAHTELIVARGDKQHPGLHLVWKVGAVLPEPRGDWHLFVDGHTGKIVRRLNLMKSTGAACVSCDPNSVTDCGTLFVHHPVDALDDPSLSDASDVDAVLQACVLDNLTSTARLDGLWANTSRTANRIGPPYDFLRSANLGAIDELTAYYHADRAKRYLDSLGFPGVMGFSIDIDAHDPAIGDNAHYVPSGDYMEFGVGGVDDAEDPDIVYHEYGHAIQDNQVPNYGITAEGGATGEGFGDYWAAALTDDSAATALGPACFAAWDAVAYNPYAGIKGSGCLRRVDGVKRYPRDFIWQVHADGEIWSAALWKLRQELGGETADKLVIKSHSFLTSSARFLHAADALLSADVGLFGGTHQATIENALKMFGLPRTAAPVATRGMNSSVPFVCESGHKYSNHDYKECRATVPGAARVRFRFAKFNTEPGYDIVRISDPDFRQVQELSGKPFGSGGGRSAAVAGDTIVARFKADYSITRWGFKIDRVYYSTAP